MRGQLRYDYPRVRFFVERGCGTRTEFLSVQGARRSAKKVRITDTTARIVVQREQCVPIWPGRRK